ncbi:restriction endonuclease subunit S [Campylobacter upsaliensis]
MAEIFTRKFSEISGGRFDPLWLLFNPKMFLKNTPFCVEALGKSIVSAKTGFAAGKENQTNRDGIIQIRPTNLDEQGILKFDKNIYVPKDISTEYLLQKGEVLFNNTNSQELVGKTAYFDLDGDFTSSNHITRIQTDTNRLLPQYLAIVLNVYQRNKVFFNICVNWNNQSGVNVELLKDLLIPLPPLSTQQHIIDLMDKAYKAKKEKENKTKELLDSIDSYLLEELGIILPLRANNTLDSRIYTQKISALSGSRFDANYHQKYYRDLEKSLHCSPYPLVNLASLINNFKKGIEVGSSEYSQNKEIPFIRVSDITNNGIDFDNVQKFISASLFENLKAYKPKQNELLYSKDGTVGICLEADVSRDYIISGGILRLELKAEVDKDFLCFLLGSYMINVFANRVSIGAVIKHLNIGEFLNLKIPLPPLAIQTQIANRLKSSKFQALSLEKEAKEILNKAKIDVETLLLSAGGGG